MSSRKSILVTGCDTYPGYMIARELLKHSGKCFKEVHAGYFKEDKLVELLKHEGAHCVKLSISDEKTICDAYGKADVVVVVPPVSDTHWGKGDCCVYLHAAVKANVKGLVLCSKINASKMRDMKMLAPFYAMEEALSQVKDQIKCVSMVRCSLDIDLLWLFRHEIAKEHTLCLPVDRDAKFAPLVMEDGAVPRRHLRADWPREAHLCRRGSQGLQRRRQEDRVRAHQPQGHGALPPPPGRDLRERDLLYRRPLRGSVQEPAVRADRRPQEALEPRAHDGQKVPGKELKGL
ncbi:hypothetical protein GGI06_003293 [Coemansia sp. S85]|nr:hypothetical protein GGI06_003293 [Coemansia sp. S85]